MEVLSDADQRQEDKARALFPDIIAMDRDIKTEAAAEAAMRSTLQDIMDIRERNDLPRVCPS